MKQVVRYSTVQSDQHMKLRFGGSAGNERFDVDSSIVFCELTLPSLPRLAHATSLASVYSLRPSPSVA